MDADFCTYMMGTARFQALADAFTKLLAANELTACRIVQDMLHEENVKANESAAPQAHQSRTAHPVGAPAVRCGLDDPNWADDKMQELDHLRYEDKQGENG